MSTYVPQQSMGAGRPTCAACGAAYRLHRTLEHSPECDARKASGVGGCWCALPEVRASLTLRCPEAYRPDTLEIARRELEAAEASGDEARVFVARGNLQRLAGRP